MYWGQTLTIFLLDLDFILRGLEFVLWDLDFGLRDLVFVLQSSLGWFARFWSSPARPTRTLHSPQRNAAPCPTQELCGTHLSNSHPPTIPRAQPPPRLPAGPLEHKSKSGSRKTSQDLAKQTQDLAKLKSVFVTSPWFSFIFLCHFGGTVRNCYHK